MKRSEFLSALEELVPLGAAGYAKDALGLQVGYGDALSTILCTFEVTETVLRESVEKNADLILTFHPLIFPSISEMNGRTRTGALLAELIKADVAVYALHTAFDTLPDIGTSWQMAAALELENVRMLAPLSGEFGKKGFGMGAFGQWSKAIPTERALGMIKAAFGSKVLRHNRTSTGEVRTVAMVGGSGMDYYDAARASGADIFITADVRYHDFYRAQHDGILLIDAGHAETERFVANGMAIAAKKAMKIVLGRAEAHGDKSVAPSVLVSAAEPNAVEYSF